MLISIVVAVAENHVIGKDNTLIWKLSDDLKNFKRITSGHSIIMGRKTFDSIGRPLPNRTNIIISRNNELKIEGCFVVNSLEAAFRLAANSDGNDEAFIIGGATIYEQALPFVDKVYLTKVNASPEGDAFFDASVFDSWKIISEKTFAQNEKNDHDFEILELVRAN